MSTPATTSQTVGPYFRIGFSRLYHRELAGAAVAGEHVTIQGQVLDGAGKPVPDAVLEIWQANAEGIYCPPEEVEKSESESKFIGFGRIPTNEDGSFSFSTIKPGSVPGPDGGMQAPHVVVSVFMRGLLTRLVTRIYFDADPRNEKDCVLNLVEVERRATLFAKPAPGRDGFLEWNITLQGKNETVFFDL